MALNYLLAKNHNTLSFQHFKTKALDKVTPQM